MRTVLTIGREPDNDLVINLPIVSGHHARVTWEGVPGQALLEDLGSSNGTAVGQIDRKITRSNLTASDVVYFGNHPVPGSELLGWVDPSLAPSLLLFGNEMVVGRDPGCHRVIDRPTVSGRHARFRRTGERIILEDLGSSNGTFVNGRPVKEPTEVRFGDLISLGVDSFRLATGASTVAGTQRMDAIRPPITSRPSPTLRVEADPIDSKSGGLVLTMACLALVLQAPILAGAIGLLSGKDVATTTFLLGLAATWFGLSTSVFGLLLDPNYPSERSGADRGGFWLSKLAILGGLCVGECVLAQVVAFPVGDLKGFGVGPLGLLILASWVGLAAGALIVLLAPSRPVAWGALGLAVVALGLFGGGPWSLPRSASVVSMISNAAPSRWAFEGLLVSEVEARPTFEPSLGGDPDPARAMAEKYFPAETDRMGPKADAMALGSMLIGLLGLGVFLVRFSGGGR